MCAKTGHWGSSEEKSAPFLGPVLFALFYSIHAHTHTVPLFTHSSQCSHLGGSLYWVGQNVCSGFSVTSYRKAQMNFLATAIVHLLS